MLNLTCNGCINKTTTNCSKCVGWNRYKAYTPSFNPKIDIGREMRMLANYKLNTIKIKKVYFNNPVTVVLWKDGTKTVVRALDGEVYDPEKGLAMAIAKKAFGNQGNYYKVFKKWLPEDPVDKFNRELKELKDDLKELKNACNELRQFEVKLLTAEELAEKLGVTKATIQKQCRDGRHPGAVKVGGKWKIPY